MNSRRNSFSLKGSRLHHFDIATKATHTAFTFSAIFLLSLFCSAFISHSFTPVSDGSASNNLDVEVNIDPVMSLAITDSTGTSNVDTMAMEVTPSVSGTFVSSSALVKASTNNETGYTITLNDIDNNTALTASTTNTSISSITTNSTNTADIELNKWGYSFGELNNNQPVGGLTNTTLSSTFNPIPALSTPQTLATTNAPANHSYPFTVASKIGMETEAGVYQDTITFTLTANYVAPNPTAGKIIYHDNGANSPTTMGEQTPSSTISTDLWPSNFQRSGYGFAGWNTKADGTGTKYGPMETITLPSNFSTKGLDLYAMWIPSAGNLQNWNGCSSLAISDVIALTDTRDNNTYAIAKLADGNCWMIENLRLGGASPITLTSADSNVTSNFTLPASTPASVWCPDPEECYSGNIYDKETLINADNISNQINTMADLSQNIYSYGNYYSFTSATAEYRGSEAFTDATTSICPSGWKLPRGQDFLWGDDDENEYGSGYYGDFNYLMESVYSNYNLSSHIGSEASTAIRSYPNNYIYSGRIKNAVIVEKGVGGRYRTSVQSDGTHAGNMYLNANRAGDGGGSDIYYGDTVRCVAK